MHHANRMSMAGHANLTLANFSMRRPKHEVDQRRSLEWLAHVHTASEATQHNLNMDTEAAFAQQVQERVERCACGPDKIAARGFVLPDLGHEEWDENVIYNVTRLVRGEGSGARGQLYDAIVSAYFAEEYAQEQLPPNDLIHTTCTGYVSPSGAQKVVAAKGWGDHTRVTHAYHMGCYASLPALRMAAGCLNLPGPLAQTHSESARVDIAHTELCSLHLDPSDHSAEQLIVQSLFGDGFIRYSVRAEGGAGLRLLAIHEAILPDSAAAMTWRVSDAGMHMTLERQVPERIAGALRGFVAALYRKAELNADDEIERSAFAVHPGGPRIVDGVQQVLELDDRQVRASRGVLHDYGNMSSATLPHIWMRMVQDANIASGTLIASLAFGPGLTACGALFRKCE